MLGDDCRRFESCRSSHLAEVLALTVSVDHEVRGRTDPALTQSCESNDADIACFADDHHLFDIDDRVPRRMGAAVDDGGGMRLTRRIDETGDPHGPDDRGACWRGYERRTAGPMHEAGSCRRQHHAEAERWSGMVGFDQTRRLGCPRHIGEGEGNFAPTRRTARPCHFHDPPRLPGVLSQRHRQHARRGCVGADDIGDPGSIEQFRPWRVGGNTDEPRRSRQLPQIRGREPMRL